MKNKCCAACGQSFRPHPQVPNQSYCSDIQCQRERRRRWQRDKLKTDADYRDNQSRAQRAWLDRNPEYWREYRDTHPEYVERNRNQQRDRSAQVRVSDAAKMDASNPVLPLPSGIYHLSLATNSGIAKMDVWTVEITVHACDCVPRVVIAKR